MFLLTVSACTMTSSTPVSEELPPANLVTYAEGSKWTWDRGGNVETSEVVSIDGDLLKFEQNNGCTYTRHADMFGPEISYENCGGRGAVLEIVNTKGQIWPLKVGNRQSWTFQSDVSGQKDSQTRSCVVDSQEQITVPAGQFDTYKIVCKSPGQNRTSYYAPSVKSNVKIVNKKIGISKNLYELISVSIVQP